MELTEISFGNYKPFAKRHTLQIRPLTVLIGRNSSGKSAVARLPLLIGSGTTRIQSPIDLDVSGVDFGGTFVDLIHNRSPHGAIELGATVDDGKSHCISFVARIQNYTEKLMQVVERFELTETGRPILALTRSPTSDPTQEDAIHKLEVEGKESVDVPAHFRGLRPYIATEGLSSELVQSAAERLASLFELALGPAFAQTAYLGPFRAPPKRSYRMPGGLPQHVGVSGIDAPALLAADSFRKRGEILKAVGEWYRSHLGGWALDVLQESSGFSLVLRHPSNPSVLVNLADAGTGLSQILSLVVQRYMEALTGKGGGLEIVEQPELHLHPAAHGDLADLYIQAAKRPGFRFILETHSENLVLRIRRRIADGTIAPDCVGIYSVDESSAPGSRLQQIEVYRSGEVSSWPKGVFSEDFEELKAIRSAQGANL